MFNHRHRRSGTLWEGRFKSCLVSTGMAAVPEDFAWSSVHANLNLRFDSLVTPHPCFLGLGGDPASRVASYRDWLRAGQGEEELQSIRPHVMQQRAYGDRRFQATVERTLNLPAALRPSGRTATRRAADS